MSGFAKRLLKAGIYGGSVCFVAYPFVRTDTTFHYQQTPFNTALLARSNHYLKAYMPGFGLSGAVRQALFNIWFAKDREAQIVYERTNLIMKDGGTISVDWAFPQANKSELIASTLPLEGQSSSRKRVCMVFPGLSGGSDRGYVKSLVKTLLSDGFEVAVFHNRGVCNTPALPA